MTFSQLREWKAFENISPFGEQREDIRIAALSAVIANVNRDSKRKPQPYKIEDFLLRMDSVPTERPKKTQSWQELKKLAKLLTEASNARPTRKRQSR